MGQSNIHIKDLLEQVGKNNASDLHLTVGNPPVFRVNSELVRGEGAKLTHENLETFISQLVTPDQAVKLDKERELDFSGQVGESRFRMNAHYERGNLAIAIRRIPLKIPNLQELRMPKIISSFCSLVRGLVLVTGPTGSGKSTTQAAMIDLINQERTDHIITIEDPIEYLHTNKKSIIEQREVGQDTLSFAGALKRVLRQDPDVVLVGEMRDLETIQTAITAAETGHLVISTLHTNDSAQAIDRMIDVFPPHQQAQIRLQLSLVLQGIVALQLLPKKDKKGVVPAVEVLVVNSAVRNIVRKATTQEIYSVIETNAKCGMVSMDASLKELYNSGLILAEDAIDCAHNPEDVEKNIKGKPF